MKTFWNEIPGKFIQKTSQVSFLIAAVFNPFSLNFSGRPDPCVMILTRITMGAPVMEISDLPHTTRGCDSQQNWG